MKAITLIQPLQSIGTGHQFGLRTPSLHTGIARYLPAITLCGFHASIYERPYSSYHAGYRHLIGFSTLDSSTEQLGLAGVGSGVGISAYHERERISLAGNTTAYQLTITELITSTAKPRKVGQAELFATAA